METIPLSIPYLVLSIAQLRDGTRQIYSRTPFGCIDISVQLIEGIQNMPLFDITVEGDLDTWILDQQMPSAFRHTLFKLIGIIAITHSGWPVHRQSQAVAHFKGVSGYFTITGHLDMNDFLWPVEAVPYKQQASFLTA